MKNRFQVIGRLRIEISRNFQLLRLANLILPGKTDAAADLFKV